MMSVQLPDKVPDNPFPTSKDYLINAAWYDEDDIMRLVADSFLYHLRGIGANVNWENLRTEIKYLMETFYTPQSSPGRLARVAALATR